MSSGKYSGINSIISRQIDKYDGQRIYIGNQVVFELSSYLGGGASGSVYQATEFISPNVTKEVAVKILNPIGFKTFPTNVIAKCTVISKGLPLTQEQVMNKAPVTKENIWWLYSHNLKQVLAAYEDPQRMKQLREVTLTKCVSIWGYQPLGDHTYEEGAEKFNLQEGSVSVDGLTMYLPLIPHSYLKWLRSRHSICREMTNMLRIGEHSNIIDLCEVLELIQDAKTTLFLVLELASGGMLFDRIKYSGGISTEEFARTYFTQLLSGIEYCHSRGVVHRDLKPENLLLSDNSDSAILKIADFGFSAVIFASENSEMVSYSDSGSSVSSGSAWSDDGRQVIGASPAKQRHGTGASPRVQISSPLLDSCEPVPLRRLRSVVGSPHYIAPEISNDVDPTGYDGRKVDMWSAGIILYSLLTGSLPFANDLSSCGRYLRYKAWINNEYAVAVRLNKLPVFPSWFTSVPMSPSVCSLLVKLLQPDPAARLSVTQAIQHPWCIGTSALDLQELRGAVDNMVDTVFASSTSEVILSLTAPSSSSAAYSSISNSFQQLPHPPPAPAQVLVPITKSKSKLHASKQSLSSDQQRPSSPNDRTGSGHESGGGSGGSSPRQPSGSSRPVTP